MFTALREFTRSWWFKGILGTVVVSFVLTFGYSGIMSNGRDIGVIRGKKIDYNDFLRLYNDLYNFYSQILKDNQDQRDFLLDPKRLRKEALERLIERELLLTQAEKQGIRAPDSELAERIKDFFERNGGFTMRRYEGFLRSEKQTKKEFEAKFRQDLILEKLQNLIKDGVQVSDQEVREVYSREKEQIQVDYAFLSPSRFADQVQVTEQEIKDYYQKSKEEFRRPAQMRAEYLRLDPQTYEEKVSPTTQELRALYEEHVDEYSLPHQVRARHILLRTPEGANAEEEGRIRKKAEELLKEAREGADFSALARRSSEDAGSAPRGGDLGYFRKDQTLKPFEEVAFSLKEGEIGGPVRTSFGFHLIKVEDIQEAHQAPLDEVKEEIQQRFVKQEVRRITRREAWKLRQTIVSGRKDFTQAAKDTHLTHGTTDFFRREAVVIQGVKSASAFAAAAFAPTIEGVSEPVEAQEGYYLIKVAEKKTSFIPPLEEVQEDIREKLGRKKSREQAIQQAQQIIDQMKKGGNRWDSLVELAGLKTESSEYFSRVGGPQLAKGPDFIQASFRLSDRGGEVGKVELPDGVYLIKPAGRKEIDEETFRKEKEDYRKKLLLQKREGVFRAWVANLVQEATKKGEVKIREERLL